MKILHVKSTTGRTNRFQIQTVIYESNGEKFVDKVATNTQAIPHLMKMKDSYKKLVASILGTNLKVAKIVAETDDTLTFEYIEGRPFKDTFSQEGTEKLTSALSNLMHSSFEVCKFDSKTITSELKTTFGDIDYSVFDGKDCIRALSNIDFTSANLICTENHTYIIDYEWVFDFQLPIEFMIFRELYSDRRTFPDTQLLDSQYFVLEEHFNKCYVFENSYQSYRTNYLHAHPSPNEEQETQNALNTHIQSLEGILTEKDICLDRLSQQLEQTDINLHEATMKLREIEKRSLSEKIRRLSSGKFGQRFECLYILLSNRFEADFYLSSYPDIQLSKTQALRHFCYHGWKEGRNPTRDFDANFYLNTYPDVAEKGINPFAHYLRHGRKEGRRPNEKGQILQKFTFFQKITYLVKFTKDNPHLIHKLITDIKRQGVKKSLARLNLFVRKNLNTAHVIGVAESNQENTTSLTIVPYYFDPSKEETVKFTSTPKTTAAVHIYVKTSTGFLNLIPKLALLPSVDLFLSVPKDEASLEFEEHARRTIQNLNGFYLEEVSSSSTPLSALLHVWGKTLERYEFVGHFHTPTPDEVPAFEHATKLLLGSRGAISNKVLSLLSKDVDLAVSQGLGVTKQAPSELSGNEELFLSRYSPFDIKELGAIQPPEIFVFWAKATCLRDLVNLSVSEQSSSKGEALDSQVIEQYLSRLLLSFVSRCQGEIYSIHDSDSLKEYLNYEEQIDFSLSITHKSVKILSYYLGQFHPIPENDEWHGKGFTEWTKVRGATPLFEGHYQQHIPHPDLGYYLLDSPDILRTQAEMMRKAGVFGQIFYHYWFAGKLILEKPSQMLLENEDIEMPFCFCWANENWTKRWDGNDDEILLGQEYGHEDARAFIQYLIPFFKDERYIRIMGRPALYIYRPSSIPDTKLYIDTWKEECEKASIPAPYIVAVLTRGTVDPEEHQMDAGVERILHDWTGGSVPELKNSLTPYQELTGSVLQYDSVAEHYINQTQPKNFTYYRSISPMWDNTPRYGANALALHESTPASFQNWLESLIGYTHKNLPEDNQFLIVNAWNEWAEGAHLEPDTYHGYAYLNSIGRALSDISYGTQNKCSTNLAKGLSVQLLLSESIETQLNEDFQLRSQFLQCLENSSIFKKRVEVRSKSSLLINNLSIVKELDSSTEVTLEFRALALFSPSTIEKLILTSLSFNESSIIANSYSEETIYRPSGNGSVSPKHLINAPIIAYSGSSKAHKRIFLCSDAKCFPAPPNSVSPKLSQEVSVIIRFHMGGSISELRNALLSLAAMKDAIVIPLIAAQDLDTPTLMKVYEVIEEIPLKNNATAIVTEFKSKSGHDDLRALMLNESLKSVKTRYASFLDHDDMLFPSAYSYLMERLETSSKAVAFGRVYETEYDGATKLIRNRFKKFEYGYTWLEFVHHNHAPLHSFLLDTHQFDFSKVTYYQDQQYMEDYLLTLQLLTKDNSDWEGLLDNQYIGDYIHSTSRAHTLALTDDHERKALLKDPRYQKDEHRIAELRTQALEQAGEL